MKRLALWVGNLLLLALAACGQKYEHFDDLLNDLYKNTVPVISPGALIGELSDSSSLVIIDAREKKEYNVSHLKDARYVGYDDFNIKSVSDLPKNTPIVVYCSVGYRSERVGEKLLKAGYTDVRNLYGGIFKWKNEGNPVYHNGRETEEVHAYSEKWGKWLTKGIRIYD